MLFCCLWRNVETSCHKHFAVLSRHQQTTPLTTSDKSQLAARWSEGVVLTTPSQQQPDIGSESRFLPTPLIFDAPVRGGGYLSEYCYAVWYGKTRMAWLPDGEKNLICLFVLTECTNVTVTQTDRQTPHDDMGRALAYHRAAKTILWELTACSAPNHVRN